MVYAGFWIRVRAFVIDVFLLMLICYPLLISIYGWSYFTAQRNFIPEPADFLITWVFPSVATIAFWISKNATPGKMYVSIKIVDVSTGDAPSVGQFIGRYFAYFLVGISLGLGFLWVVFDKRKQGWHDKLAGTIVVRQL